MFGEHLLKQFPLNPVALVEAPKTAIYGTLYFGLPKQPGNFLWLAVYNLSSLNLDKCQALQNRDVYLFPDLSNNGKAFDLWSKKARELKGMLPGTKFTVSNLLEAHATNSERYTGCDLADYLIKLDWRRFRTQPTNKTNLTKPYIQDSKKLTKANIWKNENRIKPYNSNIENFTKLHISHNELLENTGKVKQENWQNEINELESYFASIEPSTRPVKLNQCCTVTNVSLFIESHLNTIKANNGNNFFLPHLDRLNELKERLNSSVC